MQAAWKTAWRGECFRGELGRNCVHLDTYGFEPIAVKEGARTPVLQCGAGVRARVFWRRGAFFVVMVLGRDGLRAVPFDRKERYAYFGDRTLVPGRNH